MSDAQVRNRNGWPLVPALPRPRRDGSTAADRFARGDDDEPERLAAYVVPVAGYPRPPAPPVPRALRFRRRP